MPGLIARALRPTSTMMIWRGTLEAQEREVTSGTDLLTHCPSKGRDSGLARIAGAKGPNSVTNKEKNNYTYKKSPHSASAREPKAPPSTPVKPNVRNPLRIPSGQAREAPLQATHGAHPLAYTAAGEGSSLGVMPAGPESGGSIAFDQIEGPLRQSPLERASCMLLGGLGGFF